MNRLTAVILVESSFAAARGQTMVVETAATRCSRHSR
jgi:hypothetical protein